MSSLSKTMFMTLNTFTLCCSKQLLLKDNLPLSVITPLFLLLFFFVSYMGKKLLLFCLEVSLRNPVKMNRPFTQLFYTDRAEIKQNN